MEELLSKYLENGSTEKEFEVRFGTKQGKITKIDYDNVIKKLKSLGFKLETNVPTDNLRIMFEGNKVRCNISGLENITNYCKNNSFGNQLHQSLQLEKLKLRNLPKNHLKLFH